MVDELRGSVAKLRRGAVGLCGGCEVKKKIERKKCEAFGQRMSISAFKCASNALKDIACGMLVCYYTLTTYQIAHMRDIVETNDAENWFRCQICSLHSGVGEAAYLH
jgi:hypothetical protein